jgi:HAD superfamily hydrolase (TIGR01509 family)
VVNLSFNSEIIKSVELVIFDKDGTLMDLYIYWSNMIDSRVNYAQKKLGFGDEDKKAIMFEMGVDLDRGKLRSEGPVGLKKREVVLQAMVDGLEKAGFPNQRDLCLESFSNADESSLGHLADIIKPIKGMSELIEALHKRGCKIAIATTDRTERAKLATKFLGISDKVDIVVGEDLVDNCKPAPDMINLILKEVGVSKKKAVMVGDAITDVEMGINAGVFASVGVCSGLTPRDELAKATKYIVGDISKIIVG